MKIVILTRPTRKTVVRTRRELKRPLTLWKHWQNRILNLQIKWSNFTMTNARYDRLLDLYKQEVNNGK